MVDAPLRCGLLRLKAAVRVGPVHASEEPEDAVVGASPRSGYRLGSVEQVRIRRTGAVASPVGAYEPISVRDIGQLLIIRRATPRRRGPPGIGSGWHGRWRRATAATGARRRGDRLLGQLPRGFLCPPRDDGIIGRGHRVEDQQSYWHGERKARIAARNQIHQRSRHQPSPRRTCRLRQAMATRMQTPESKSGRCMTRSSSCGGVGRTPVSSA